MNEPMRGSVLPELSVIDTHVHVWDKRAPWMSWLADRPASWDAVRRDFSWADLRSVLDRAGVARLLLVQAATSVPESQRLLELASRHDSVVGVVGWATLTDPAATEADLDALSGVGGLVGIRSLHRWDPDGDVLTKLPSINSRVLECLHVIGDRGLQLDLFLNDHTELPLAIALAERMPSNMHLIIDHLGRPPIGGNGTFADWAQAMATLSTFPHVYVKYSGWATPVERVAAADVRPYVEFALERFGCERVMYASNWPVALVAGGYQATFDATLAAVRSLQPADLANVFASTAERCYLRTASV
jgi:L-fuconolactonase